MKISIIVCAYNEEKNISSCLISLIDQRDIELDDYEVIIIDDGSKDQTGKIAKRIVHKRKNSVPSLRYIRIEHKGLSIGRNTGLFLSKSPLVAYIDVDAVADQYWVSQIQKAWELNPDADAIGGRIKIRNQESEIARFLHINYYDHPDKYAIIGANMSFKKDKLLQIGAFGDPFISRGDETFLLSKMGSSRREVKCMEAIVFHDRPASFGQWLKERGSNGEMARIISLILNDRKNQCKEFLVRRGILLLLVIVALFLPVSVWWGLLFFGGVFLLKLVQLKTYKTTKEQFSFGKAFWYSLIWPLLIELGTWKSCLGWFRGSHVSFANEKAIMGTVSDQYIEETVNNSEISG